MLRKDFILRQFEEFGKVLALILGFKNNKDWEKFEKEVADAAKKFTSLDISHVENLSDAAFESDVIDSETLNQEQKTILASLLFEKMNYYITIGNQEMYRRLKTRCFDLYSYVRENSTENEFNLDVHYKLEFLGKMED
ncbi:MAG: hypothetical protein V4635_17730 [Bacteroidota bacterium]